MQDEGLTDSKSGLPDHSGRKILAYGVRSKTQEEGYRDGKEEH